MNNSIPNHKFNSWELQEDSSILMPSNWTISKKEYSESVLRYPNESDDGYHLYLAQKGQLKTTFSLLGQPKTLQVFLKSFLEGDQVTILVILYNNDEVVSKTEWKLAEDIKEYTKFEIAIAPIKGKCTTGEIVLIGPQFVRSEETGVHIKSIQIK